jgi:hypothetical protein
VARLEGLTEPAYQSRPQSMPSRSPLSSRRRRRARVGPAAATDGSSSSPPPFLHGASPAPPRQNPRAIAHVWLGETSARQHASLPPAAGRRGRKGAGSADDWVPEAPIPGGSVRGVRLHHRARDAVVLCAPWPHSLGPSLRRHRRDRFPIDAHVVLV